ncbi:tRNA (guanosine(46)-N7)-methyltransferase TrmB [Bacillaceae bacterium S4-13-58]
MRMRNKPWADEFLAENQSIIVLNPTQHKGIWNEQFNKSQPVHLEIGTGMGGFISGMALQHPDINFVGIEKVKSVIVNTVKKVKEAGCSNIKLLNEDAVDVRDYFAESEIDQIYLNFSDPWPKTRYAKRRLTYRSFLEQYQVICKPGAYLVFKTDNQGLIEYSLSSFSKFGLTIQDVSLNLHQLNDPLNVMTEYEERFAKKGLPIYRATVQFPE